MAGQQRGKLNVHLEKVTEEVASSGGSSLTVSPPESQPHLTRDPLLVSPGPHTVTSLLHSPVSSTPSSLVSTDVSTAVTNVQSNRKPPVHPSRRESGRQKKRGKDVDSSSSSSESLTTDSDNESLDLQDEARDVFDTSK